MSVKVAQLLLACGLLPLAAAAADCHVNPSGTAGPDALANLLQRESACARDANFLYHLGQLLNLAGQYAEAAERLESALLRAPDDTHIQLEYAVALAGSGDTVAAQQLLEQVRQHATLDTSTRQEIDQLLGTQRWRELMPRASLHLSAGYDDNLQGAVNQGPFELTLPYGNIQVTPSASQQPRGGTFARSDLNLSGEWSLKPGQRLRYDVFGSLFQTPAQTADRQHWGVSLENSNNFWPDDYLQVVWQHIGVNGQNLYWQTHLAAGRGTHFAAGGGACQQRLGVELQRRSYPQTNVLDGQYTGLHAQWACPEPAFRLDLRLGQDHPRSAQRPGGDQQQFSLRATRQIGLLGGVLQAQAEWSWLQDTQGYSQLLDNNRARSLRRNIYRLEYRWATLSGWQPGVSLEWLQQQANLPLFSLRNHIVSLGFTRVW